MAALVLILLLCAPALSERRSVNEALVERINNGVKMAKEYFGMDSAAVKAANMVMSAFQSKPSQYGDKHTDKEAQSQTESFGALRNIVRLFGMEPSQISAVAVNAIIFVAQMITTFLSGGQTHQQGRTLRSGEPTSWIIERNSSKLQTLLTLAKNQSLPNILEDYIKEKGKEEETSCIQLLMCKITPFVSKMQGAVFGKAEEENGRKKRDKEDSRSSVLYRHLPSRGEVETQSEACEKKYPACDIRN